MPPPTLSDAEIRSLIAYLELLSGVPGAANRQIAVRESSYRIGEHIVKSTCHVCHSATGANQIPSKSTEERFHRSPVSRRASVSPTSSKR